MYSATLLFDDPYDRGEKFALEFKKIGSEEPGVVILHIVGNVLANLDPITSPGGDGLPFVFYKRCIDP